MNRSTVEEIKARIPIEELIGSYVKLEKAGKSFKAKCPFHNEKTASFFISPERGGYYCFGCSAKGDIFSFVEQFEGLDFRGALKVLAERAGVPLDFGKDNKADSEKDILFRIMEDAVDFYEKQYEISAEAKDYVQKRGISQETRSTFRIGWAPQGWKNVLSHLKKKGYSEVLIEKAGLIKRREEKKAGLDDVYDRFRGRVMFPIMDTSGRVIAFSGRILVEDEKNAKYLNSPETPLFNKSQVLFGLDKAKSEIRRLNYSILVEGQMDLVLSHQAGVRNTIAASGTALTDQMTGESGIVSNLGLVRRLSSNMIIALDSDKAGRMATMRAVAATALGMGMSVKIAVIEGGKDPADLILQDPELWKNVLKGSKHVVEFELDNILREVSDPHKLGRAVNERLFPFLIKLDSEMDKAYYIKLIAERTGTTERAVWDDVRRSLSKNSSTQNSNVAGAGASLGSSARNFGANPVGNPHRLDLVERRMFGLLALMDAARLPVAEEYRNRIREIAGASYEERIRRIAGIQSEISFEAEAFFGNDTSRWGQHMEELILNFEEDIINEQLVSSMAELRAAEKSGNSEKASKMAAECQKLSVRKAEIVTKRHR